jgi:hypothetical protein
MCGNTINHNSPMADSTCNTVCNANKYDTSCGGGCLVSIYRSNPNKSERIFKLISQI